MPNKTDLITATVLLILALSMPLLGIWSLNTLFGLGIGYTFWNWLAALILMAIIQAGNANARNDNN